MIIDVFFDPQSPYLWLLILGILIGAIAVMIRPFTTFVRFSYPNAKFEAIGNPFVIKNNLQRYLEISDLQTFVDQLNSQKDYTLKENTASSIQSELDIILFDTIQMMKKDSSKKMKSFYETYTQLLDAHVLKTAFKQFIQKQNIDEQLAQKAKSSTLQHHLHLLSSTEPDQIGQTMKQLTYPDEFISHITEPTDENDKAFLPLVIDAGIDKILLNRLDQVTVPYKCTEAKQIFIKRIIDIQIIKHLLRAKQLSFSPDQCKQLLIKDGYELPLWKQEELCQAENIADIISRLEGTSYYQSLKQIDEKTTSSEPSAQHYTDALDQLWLTLLKDLSMAHYSTIGPSLRFLEYKKQEIRNLKIITKGIAEHLPSSLISPLLIMEESS